MTRGRAAALPAPALLACLLLALGPGISAAQVPDFPPGPPMRFSGRMGAHFELYGISGRIPQRPSSTGRLFLDSRMTLFGSVSMSVSALLSTEGSSAIGTAASRRQQLNQIGLNPRWDWGRAYLGAFSDSYSPLTWNGVQVQGAGFAIDPGPLRIAAFGGRSQRSVTGGATGGAYARTMWGGRIGVGDGADGGERGSHLDVIFLRAADDVSSLAPPPVPVDSQPQDLFADTFPSAPENRQAVTPQENVVLGTAGSLELLGDALHLQGQVSGAIYTRDRRASNLDPATLDRYPGLLKDVITPRVSTTADYAYTAQARYRIDRLPGGTDRSPRSLDLTARYRYVGPGYVSLGAPSLLADQQAAELRSRLRFRTWSLGLSGLRQHDNLIGQKQATTTRDRLAGTFSYRPGRRWTASFRGTFLTMSNDAEDPDRLVDYTNWIGETRQTLRFGRTGLLRSASIRYAFRTSSDAGARGPSSDLIAHTVGLRTTVMPVKRVSVSASVGLVESRSGRDPWRARATYGLTGRYAPADARWSLGASAYRAALEGATSTRFALSSRFRVIAKTSIDLRLRSNLIRNDTGDRPDSDEFTLSLDLRREL